MTAEDDRSGGSVRKLSEDDGRWQFDVLQLCFRQAGGGHAYHHSHGTSARTLHYLTLQELRP